MCGSKDNTEMDPVKKVGGVDWIRLSLKRDQLQTLLNDNEALSTIKCGECLSW
jgi:hypothetical protein